MGWTIVLENEKRDQLDALDVDFFSSVLDSERNGFELLKYLDPYGDTFFNYLQIDDLISDLEKLKKLDASNTAIDEIIILAGRCKNRQHSYLCFYGD